MFSLHLRFAVLMGGALLLAACDKCGDSVHFNTPKLPNSCFESAPAQK